MRDGVTVVVLKGRGGVKQGILIFSAPEQSVSMSTFRYIRSV